MLMFLFSPYIRYTVLDGFTICHASVFHAYTVLQGHVLRGLFLGVVFAMLVVIPFSNDNMGERMHKECEVAEQMKTPVRYSTIKDVNNIQTGITIRNITQLARPQKCRFNQRLNRQLLCTSP